MGDRGSGGGSGVLLQYPKSPSLRGRVRIALVNNSLRSFGPERRVAALGRVAFCVRVESSMDGWLFIKWILYHMCLINTTNQSQVGRAKWRIRAIKWPPCLANDAFRILW